MLDPLEPLDPVPPCGDEAGAAAALLPLPHAGADAFAPAAVGGLAGTLMRALLDELDEGIVVCDAAGRPVLINRAAREELTSADALRIEGGRLATSDCSGQVLLDTDLRDAALGDCRRLRVLPGRSARLFVAVLPLPGDGMPTGLALVLIGRRALCQDLAIDRLAEAHGLTPSERRVLGDLLAGLHPACIAAARRVELSTVRTQIAALRGKLGAASIDDLIRLAASQPSTAAAQAARPAGAHRGSLAAPMAATLAAWMSSPIAGPLAPRAAARAATLAVSTACAAASAASRRSAGA